MSGNSKSLDLTGIFWNDRAKVSGDKHVGELAPMRRPGPSPLNEDEQFFWRRPWRFHRLRRCGSIETRARDLPSSPQGSTWLIAVRLGWWGASGSPNALHLVEILAPADVLLKMDEDYAAQAYRFGCATNQVPKGSRA